MAVPPLRPVREPGADDGKEPFGIPVAELLAAEIDPPQWIVPGYIQEGSISVLAGPPNSGKTLLAFDWCAQLVARGKRVFIAENEGGTHSLQKRLSRACGAAGLSKLPSHFAYLRNLQMSLANTQAVRNFAKELLFYDFILLDSLAALWPGLDENDSSTMGLAAEALLLIRETTGAAVTGIHHTTKAAWKPGERPSLGDLRGHGAMAGRIDAAFICRPMERVAGSVRFELHTVKQRDEDWTPPQAVDILMTGTAATVTLEPLGNEKRLLSPLRIRQIEIENAVVAILPESESEAISQNIICERVKKAKIDVLAAIKRLFLQRLIIQTWNNRFHRTKAAWPSDSGSRQLFSGRDRAAGEKPSEIIVPNHEHGNGPSD